MNKTYIAVSTIGLDGFERDIHQLIKPEALFSIDSIIEDIVEKAKESTEEGAKVIDYPKIGAEKTIGNQDVHFQFRVIDSGITLAIHYLGHDE